MARAAESLGYEYIAVTDHSGSLKIAGGLDEEKLQRQIEEIDKLDLKVHIFKGIEVNIRLDGQLDIPDDILSKLDIVIASIHSPGREDMTERILSAIQDKHVHMIGHPTGRKLFQRVMKNMASAYFVTPEILPGNNIMGTSKFSLRVFAVASNSMPLVVDPPSIIPSDPPWTAIVAILRASCDVCSSGSMRVRCIFLSLRMLLK